MSDASVQFFFLVASVCVLLLVAAAYCIVSSRNMIRILIGVELLTKSVTLLLATGGYISGRTALGQSLIVTLIVVEVVIIAIAAGVVIGAYGHTRSLDVRNLQNLNG